VSNVEAIVETLVRDFQPFLVVLYGSRALTASRFARGLGDRYLVGHAGTNRRSPVRRTCLNFSRCLLL
jgi:hypothetical protein